MWKSQTSIIIDDTSLFIDSRKPNRTWKEVDMEEREVEEEYPRKEVYSLYGADAVGDEVQEREREK